MPDHLISITLWDAQVNYLHKPNIDCSRCGSWSSVEAHHLHVYCRVFGLNLLFISILGAFWNNFLGTTHDHHSHEWEMGVLYWTEPAPLPLLPPLTAQELRKPRHEKRVTNCKRQREWPDNPANAVQSGTPLPLAYGGCCMKRRRRWRSTRTWLDRVICGDSANDSHLELWCFTFNTPEFFFYSFLDPRPQLLIHGRSI